jgi:hypothetical protein
MTSPRVGALSGAEGVEIESCDANQLLLNSQSVRALMNAMAEIIARLGECKVDKGLT